MKVIKTAGDSSHAKDWVHFVILLAKFGWSWLGAQVDSAAENSYYKGKSKKYTKEMWH